MNIWRRLRFFENRYSHFIFIVILFFVTLWMRWDAFRDPVKGSHVWLTAHTAMTLQIWDEEGISARYFSPAYTFSSPPNKHLRSLASGLSDSSGNYYYVSYPPLSFILAYAYINIFQLEPGMPALQSLNLILQLLISWLLYVVVCLVQQRPELDRIYPPAFLSSILYLFSAQAMWCHGYMYFADTVIQLFWVAGIALSTQIFFRAKSTSRAYVMCLGATVFLAAYTEWLGFFFAATLFMIALYFSGRDRSFIRVAAIVAISTTAAFTLALLQYAQIDGLSTYLQASVDKYTDRSGYNTENF